MSNRVTRKSHARRDKKSVFIGIDHSRASDYLYDNDRFVDANNARARKRNLKKRVIKRQGTRDADGAEERTLRLRYRERFVPPNIKDN